MATRPYWTGQIRISLVTLAVTLQPAVRHSSQLPLHELDRRNGERIRHQNVNDEGKPVERDDIVKGYEVEKDHYVLLEDEEIENIRLPSSDTLELDDFIDISAIPVLNFERPYFVLPANKKAEEIYQVFAEALRAGGKAGIGQIALRGREELCVVIPYAQGLVIETLRYETELFELPEIFTRHAAHKAKGEYVTLARQLIRENSRAVEFGKFHDHYHEALQELIDAKHKHQKPRYTANRREPAKIVDFAEALRRSLKAKDAPSASRRTATPKRRRA